MWRSKEELASENNKADRLLNAEVRTTPLPG